MIDITQHKAAVAEAARTAPAVVGAGVANTAPPDPTILGLTLPNLAAVLTIVYTAFLIGDWIHKKIYRLRRLKSGRMHGERTDDTQ